MRRRSDPLGHTDAGLCHRVLILSAFWPPHAGGVERYAEAMADELAVRGWEVHAAFSDVDLPKDGAVPIGVGATDGAQAQVHAPRAPMLHQYPVTMLAGRLPVPNLWMSSWRSTRRTLAGMPFDLVVVMSHHYLANVMLARTVRARETLWINHVSGHIPTGRGPVSWLVHRYEHVLAALQRRTSTQAAGVSTAAAAWLEHLGVSTTRVLPNAVRADAVATDAVRAGASHKNLEVAYVGRIEPGKGWDTAIEIVRRLVDALPGGHDVRLSVAGGGTRERELVRLARDEPHVRLLGQVPHAQVMELLHDADVLLLPTRYPEGLPTVLLEAGSVALPVVAFPAGGTIDLVADGVSGVVVEDVDAAVRALVRIATDPAAAQELGSALQQRILDHFTWPRVVDALLGDHARERADLDPEVSRVP